MNIPSEKILPINHFTATVPLHDAAHRFATTLHKESVKTRCNAIRLIIDSYESNFIAECNDDNSSENKNIVSSYASNNIIELINWSNDRKIASMQNPNVYLTVNDFRNYQRTAQYCHKLNCIYIDIDCHNYSANEREFILDKLQDTLNDLWNNGTLLHPTLITHTGRGYGLFYVLSRSIACVSTTTKLQNYYKFVYSMLIKAYSILLSGTDITVDTCVMDCTRVVRVPGSFNYKAYRTCELYDIEPIYYSLREIYDGCHLENYVLPREEYQALKYGK